jgi:uncharacterized protein (DUF1684 family)
VSRSHLQDVERWRTGRLASLTGSDGWLTLVGLWWLEEGKNPIGSDPSNRVVLPAGKSPPYLGSIELVGGIASATLRPDAGVTNEGEPVSSLRLRDDSHSTPTILRLGSLSFYVIERDGDLAVRVKDSESPTRTGFRGIEHYPVDDRWQLRARFEANDPPRHASVQTLLGRQETYLMPGALAFELDGRAHRLDVFLEEGETDLFVVFGDLTNGDSTFGGGRYVYTRPPDDDGMVLIDFNKAYNPPCVFTPHATCPLPLPQNLLPVRIEAGEKRYAAPVAHA